MILYDVSDLFILGRKLRTFKLLSKDPAELLAVYWIFIYLPHKNRTDNFSEKNYYQFLAN